MSERGEAWAQNVVTETAETAYVFGTLSAGRGGAVLADGLLLATDGNTKLHLIDPDPAAFKLLASAELLEYGNNWAPLALADSGLLIRDHKQLKVVQVAQQIK